MTLSTTKIPTETIPQGFFPILRCDETGDDSMAQSRARPAAKRKRSPATKRSSSRSGGSLWLWGAALVVVGGSIALYDHSTDARRFVTSLTTSKPVQTASRPVQRDDHPVPPKPVVAAAPVHRPVTPKPTVGLDQSQTAAIIPPAPIGKPGLDAVAAQTAVQPGAQSAAPRVGEKLAGAYQAKFFFCGSAKQDDCVVSADRFVLHGQKIRLVGVEVPNIAKPRCEAERIKASDAKLRVRAFLDSGPFDLMTWRGNDSAVDGHQLREVTRNGRSLADILVNEGLAKRPGAGKSGWCS
jgi:endonuclease YncB( thermonuclease family)